MMFLVGWGRWTQDFRISPSPLLGFWGLGLDNYFVTRQRTDRMVQKASKRRIWEKQEIRTSGKRYT